MNVGTLFVACIAKNLTLNPMKTLYKVVFVTGILLISLTSFSQPKTAPSWSARFTSAINWQRVHSLGFIIVSTNDGLYGINPAEGTIAWENTSFKALDPSRMEEVN